MKLLSLICMLTGVSLFAQHRPGDPFIGRPSAAESQMMNKGLDLYRHAQFPEAAALLRQVVNQNPSLTGGRVYLALALMAQYRPGVTEAANLELAREAEKEFRNVLEFDPDNKQAIYGIGHLTMLEALSNQNRQERQQKLEESTEWFKTLADIDVWNREAVFNVGYTIYQRLEPSFLAARAAAQPPQLEGELIKDDAVRNSLKKQFSPLIDEAIKALERTIGLDPNYTAPRTYLTMIYRMRASISEDEVAQQKDLAEAKRWEKRTEAKTPTQPQ